jgi:hypothetical protein
MKTMSEAKLTITIENKRPIELLDFTESFESLAQEYYKFLNESDNKKISKDTKLYVQEIRSGSIITVLSDLTPILIPFVEDTNSIVEFAKFIKIGLEYFLGKTNVKPKDFDYKDCSNFNNIIKPVAKDNGSNIIFNADCNIESVTMNFNFSSLEANAIQNGIAREIEKIKIPDKKDHDKVLFYWDSAKYDDKSKSVDKGYIDSLYEKPLRVTFDNPETKFKMLNIDNNPFHYAFIVDVEILTIQNTPSVYKILALHDSFLK